MWSYSNSIAFAAAGLVAATYVAETPASAALANNVDTYDAVAPTGSPLEDLGNIAVETVMPPQDAARSPTHSARPDERPFPLLASIQWSGSGSGD